MNTDQKQLRNKINEVSFALDDVVLFLDTHPHNAEALEYYTKVRNMRQELVAEYAKKFGPLTKEQVITCSSGSEQPYFTWVNEPWPWEGGNC